MIGKTLHGEDTCKLTCSRTCSCTCNCTYQCVCKCNVKSFRCTTLHVAAYEGQPDVVRDLLISGADPTLTDSNGFTPAHTAQQLAQSEESKNLRANYQKCYEVLMRYEEKRRMKKRILTPQKATELINSVVNRDPRPRIQSDSAVRTPPMRSRFASTRSPSGRPPISPRTPIRKQSDLIGSGRKQESKKWDFSSSSSSSGSSLNTSLLDITNRSHKKSPKVAKNPKVENLVKSPVKDSSTQTPREVECQTEFEFPEVISEVRKSEPKKIDLDEIQKFMDELTVSKKTAEIEAKNEVKPEVAQNEQNSTKNEPKLGQSVISEVAEAPEVITEVAATPKMSPEKPQIKSPEKVTELDWGYFDKSIRLPDLDETRIPEKIEVKAEVNPDAQKYEPVKSPVKIKEVPEVEYQNNETCVIGDLSTESSNSLPLFDDTPEVIEKSKLSRIEELSENSEAEISAKIDPKEITPFPSSIINLVSMPMSMPMSMPKVPEVSKIAEEPVAETELSEEEPVCETTSEESAESFKLEFSLSPSVSFRSVQNDTISQTLETSARSTVSVDDEKAIDALTGNFGLLYGSDLS